MPAQIRHAPVPTRAGVRRTPRTVWQSGGSSVEPGLGMRSNWPLAIQEECENACFRTFATRFLVLSALEEAVRGIGEHWHSLEVGFKPYPVGLFNIGPVEACLAMLGEAPVDVGQIEAVNIETYHDARKFTGEKYTTTPQQLRGRAPVHAVLGRGHAHGRRDAPPGSSPTSDSRTLRSTSWRRRSRWSSRRP